MKENKTIEEINKNDWEERFKLWAFSEEDSEKALTGKQAKSVADYFRKEEERALLREKIENKIDSFHISNEKINIKYFCPCGKERTFNSKSMFSTSGYDDIGSYICEHGNWIIPQQDGSVLIVRPLVN